MQDKIARQVHQVLGYGLELKERLERGERPNFEAEQSKLRGLLLGDSELKFDPVYAGELASQTGANIRTSQGALRDAEPFRGIRYALACWLDEVFIADSPWSQQWTETTMEVALYKESNQRAWRFWEQAKKAEAKPGTDALEVFVWCVMLGFRGEPAGSGINPPQWIESVRKRVLNGYSQEFAQPAEKEPPTFVPVLRGRDRFGMMLRVTSVVVILAVFAIALLAIKGLGAD